MSTAVKGGEGDLSPISLVPINLPSPNYTEAGEWRDHARCREEGNYIFFVDYRRGESRKLIQENFAKACALCNDCSVRLHCLNYAINSRMRHGIWAGVRFDKISDAEIAEVAKQLEGFNP